MDGTAGTEVQQEGELYLLFFFYPPPPLSVKRLIDNTLLLWLFSLALLVIGPSFENKKTRDRTG